MMDLFKKVFDAQLIILDQRMVANANILCTLTFITYLMQFHYFVS
jgi:hypothetical protein